MTQDIQLMEQEFIEANKDRLVAVHRLYYVQTTDGSARLMFRAGDRYVDVALSEDTIRDIETALQVLGRSSPAYQADFDEHIKQMKLGKLAPVPQLSPAWHMGAIYAKP